MNLTEPHAGSDLGLLRTKAENKMTALIKSATRIWITYGEHDLTDNIIHLVIARTPEAGDDVKGYLFIVLNSSLTARNDVKYVGLDLKAWHSCFANMLMQFGDDGEQRAISSKRRARG